MGGCDALCRCGCAWTDKGTQFHCVKFRLGSAGEPTLCSHCYSVPYMKIPANNQVILAQKKTTICTSRKFGYCSSGQVFTSKVDHESPIKSVIAVAAYIRLASRSQAKISKQMKIETSSGFHAQPHLRVARHPPNCHFNSRLARVQLCLSHALSQWPSQALFEAGTKLVGG